MALQLPQRLTHDQARACSAALIAQMTAQGTKATVLDASALQVFDSSALAVILSLRRAAGAAGGSLLLQGLPVRLQSLARLYGIDTLIEDPAASGAA
ncbi:phospholipid transport system transporter-binding protein [Sphaerotilus hippei]|uniref:Phospholipid transport system transporter-binding protein n=1 Tax=Sphaerotilus hippei TaxID=744406 RepID=A0A318H2X0_9BURK|nr:STAS domain-containing protein [Sphaerotilus hippei]PXW97139.1 phospholipid transport system transporter-binding protein [Sphaerotilus hippei]